MFLQKLLLDTHSTSITQSIYYTPNNCFSHHELGILILLDVVELVNKMATTPHCYDEAALLEQTYMYQSSLTGALSNAPLTAKQLILLLSPAAGVILEHVTPTTNLIKVQEEAYDEEWKSADSIPILKHACAQYHYQDAKDGA